jgi:hypothetical protein
MRLGVVGKYTSSTLRALNVFITLRYISWNLYSQGVCSCDERPFHAACLRHIFGQALAIPANVLDVLTLHA